jgi:hypothetical protein
VYQPLPTIEKEGERTWSDIARSANFASLSVAEKDSVREAHFERVIAPKVPAIDLAAAREEFYRESGHGSVTSPLGNDARTREVGRIAAANPTWWAGDAKVSGTAAPTPPITGGRNTPTAQATAPCFPISGSWPVHATYLDGFQRRASSGLTTITIDNTSGGADVYVKLCRPSPDKCDGLRHVFIPRGELFTLRNITPGSYDVRYCSLDDGAMAKSEPLQLRQIESAEGISYSTVTLTLYRVAGGNTHFEGVSEEKF